MDSEKPVSPHTSAFEQIKKLDGQGAEYWNSRDLARVLGYDDYRNFLGVVKKAKTACVNSGQQIVDHFVDITDMVKIGSGTGRDIESIALSRYACYLVIQNADPSKAIVALGQTYFAIQTRKQELSEQNDDSILGNEEEQRLLLREEIRQHNKLLSATAKKAGVVQPLDFAIFQDEGYKGLYGGLTQKNIHTRKSLKKSQKILDHMGSTELAANLFRATQTEDKIRRENIRGKTAANQTHHDVGTRIRKTIEELGGTMPENLPIAENIKKIQRKMDKERLLESASSEE